MEENRGWKIVQRCLHNNDEQAWTAFRDRFEPALLAGVRRVVRSLGTGRNQADAIADLLQEAYCRLLSRDRRVLELCRERDERALDAFFSRVAERSARDSYRSRWAQKRGSRDRVVAWSDVVEDRAAAVGQVSPEGRLLLEEARAGLLEKCRQAAGSRQRERNFRVLALAFLEGLSSREIAERFAGRLSRTCIDSVVYRARQRLLKEGVVLGDRKAMA